MLFLRSQNRLFHTFCDEKDLRKLALQDNMEKEWAIDAKCLSNMAKWLRWELGKGLSEVDAGSHGAAWGQIYPEYSSASRKVLYLSVLK